MKGLLRNALVVASFVFAVGLSANAQTVTGSIKGGAVTRGKPTRATVTLSIPAGLHVNSSRPSGEFMIATTVKATSQAGVRVSGVTYPRGVNRKFEFSQQPINVYEGRVNFGFNVTPSKTFRGRQVVVNVTVHYQACTNEVCYAPKTKSITLRAQVN